MSLLFEQIKSAILGQPTVKITALYEGSYSVAADKKFIPFDPTIHNPKDRPGSIFVHVSPFLVEMDRELILLDTGLGYSDEDGKPWLYTQIEKAGYRPKDITKVLMSHLHFDHAGGMLYKQGDKWVPGFPDAEYYVQRGELETALTRSSKSYNQEALEQMRRYGNLNLLDGNGSIAPGIRYELTGAHCEFHQVFILEENGEIVFFGGDVLPEPIQLVRNFIAKYDLDGRKAMELRKQYGQLAVEQDWTCLFYHADAKSIGKVALVEGGFTVNGI